MSSQFDKSVTEVSYLVGIYVLVLGAGPLIWNSFTQIRVSTNLITSTDPSNIIKLKLSTS